MDKLFDQTIPLELWSIIDDMYSGLTTRVKWKGELSNTYPVLQGVSQGGILSTHLYKIFVQDLLSELEENSLGYHLGNVYIGTPTCADDVAIIERDSNNLQIMINVISRYAKQHHYKINPLKTRIHDCSKHPSVDECWEMNGIDIKPSYSAVHLGVTRSGIKEVELNIEERIKCARRTQYGLLRTGFHGTNGIDPITAYQIYKSYVLPRLLYGLEILPLTRTQINLLEGFHRKSIRYMQLLPQRTAVSTVYLLIGAYPVEAKIHLRQLPLLYSLLSCHNGKIKEVVSRQISVN
jgi:hypothetical protein